MTSAREKRLEAAREVIATSAALHVAIQGAIKQEISKEVFFELAQQAWDFHVEQARLAKLQDEG